MTTIHIPASIDDAVSNLNGLGALLTAKEWERAAIVYAFTQPSEGGHPVKNLTGSSLSIAAFASLGITGLGSRPAVTAYRNAWLSAMQDGAPDVKPGSDIELPSLPWKSVFGESTPDVQERVARKFIENNPDAIDQMVAKDPAIAKVISKQVLDNPTTRVRTTAALDREQEDRTAAMPPKPSRTGRLPAGFDLEATVGRVLGDMSLIFYALGKGQTLGAFGTIAMGLNRRMVQAYDAGEDLTPIFDEIDTFLAGGVKS
jgi:hypothetical protein